MGLGRRRHGPELIARLLTSTLEEIPQQGGTLVAAHTPEDVDSVSQLRFTRQIDDAAAGARLRIPGTEHHSRYACIEGGAHAHGAWFQGHVERGPFQSIISQSLRSRAQRDDFCVRRRILTHDRPVPSLSDHIVSAYQQSHDRHVGVEHGSLRRTQRAMHEIDITGRPHPSLLCKCYRRRTYRTAKIAAYRTNNAAAL